MLIEIFNDRIYDETISDPEHGIVSKRVPYIITSESGDTSKYHQAAKFILNALDNPHFRLTEDKAYFMMEIELISKSDFSATINATTSYPNTEYKFSYKFNCLRPGLSTELCKTIHGEMILDEAGNMIGFTRDKVLKKNTTTTVLSNKQFGVDSATSSIVHRISPEHDFANTNPFDSGCQQEVPTDSSEGAGSQDTTSPIELSENSFSVDDGTIEVSDPELEIGSVKGSSFNVDAEKQRTRDQFMKTINKKMAIRIKKKES